MTPITAATAANLRSCPFPTLQSLSATKNGDQLAPERPSMSTGGSPHKALFARNAPVTRPLAGPDAQLLRPFDADALAHIKVHAKHGWLHEKNKQAKRMLRLTYGQREARKNVGLGLFNGGNFCEQGADGVSSEDGRQAA